MTRDNLESAKIECRRGSGYPVWNITAFFERKNAREKADYANLVAIAKQVLAEAKRLRSSDGWYARSADVMAWSSAGKMGILCANEYRVTVDMVNKKDEPDEDDEETC